MNVRIDVFRNVVIDHRLQSLDIQTASGHIRRNQHHGFALQWAKTYIVAWPIAAVVGFLILPTARRLTALIVAFIGRAA